jgi:small subunit ribosomal protein S2
LFLKNFPASGGLTETYKDIFMNAVNVPYFSLRQLINAGVHFGHTTRRWNPKMKQYIFGDRNGVHIIDLEQTVPLLHQSLVAVRNVAAKGGRVLFIGTKRQASEKVAEAAKKCGQYYVNHRWLGGMMTNWTTISNSIKALRQVNDRLDSQKGVVTKKELLQMTRLRDNLERTLGGIKDMAGLPDIIIIIDTNKEAIAIQEANRLGIPVVAILDSNSDPDGIQYPVPGNDDAKRAIDLYCDLFSSAVLDGLQEEMNVRGVDVGEMELPPEEALPETANTESVDVEKKAFNG